MKQSVTLPCIRGTILCSGKRMALPDSMTVALAHGGLRENALHDGGLFIPMHRLMFEVRSWCSVK